MKNIFLIVFTILIASCNQNSKTGSTDKKKEKKKEAENINLDTVDINKTEETQLTTIEPVEKCLCPEPFEKAATQKKIDYGERFLKFCSWDFDSVKMTSYEFHLYDDKDSILMTGNIPTEFKVVGFENPLNLIQSFEMPNETGDWKYVPILKYEIGLHNNTFIVQKDFTLKIPEISSQRKDTLLGKFYKKPNYGEITYPEEYIMDLFLCAVSGKKDCQKPFEDLNSRMGLDGSVGELYTELRYLFDEYKNN